MTPNIWFLATTRVDFKWLVDFNTGKTQTYFVWLIWQLYCYGCENGWVCSWKKKNHLSRCWDCLCYLNSTGALMLSLLLKVPPRKMELWFVLWNVFLLRLLFIYINEPYNLVWNNVLMSGLVLLGAIWIFWINYRNRYVGLLFFHLLLSWTVGSSSKFSQLKSFL